VGRAKDRLGRVGNRLRTLPDEGVQFGTRSVKASVLAGLRRDAGPDRRLSGVRNGVAQTVKTTHRRYGNLVEGRVMAGPRGQRAPWFWLEEGTRAGRRGAPVGRFGGSARAERGWHPGTPAKHTWSAAVRPATDEVREEFVRLWKDALNDTNRRPSVPVEW
jgi:hypothetical protein